MVFRYSRVSVPAILLLLCACGGKEGAANHPQTHIAPAIHRFEAVPPVIKPGHTTHLVVEFGPGHGEVDQGIGPVRSGVPVLVSPTQDTTYTLIVRMPRHGEGWKAQGMKEGGLKHVELSDSGIRRSVRVKVDPPLPKIPGR